MKFIRDLIEQKSSGPAAPGQLAAGNLDAPKPQPEAAEKPFAASELYRIVEDDADDDTGVGFDAIGEADGIFGDDLIESENDKDPDEPAPAKVKVGSAPAANAATEDLVARLTRPLTQPETAFTPTEPVVPETAAAPAAKPEPAPRSAAGPAAAAPQPVQAPDAAANPVTRPQRPSAPAAAPAAASAPKPAQETVSRSAPQAALTPQVAGSARPAQATPESGPAAVKRPDSDTQVSVDVPASSAGRGMGRAGRAKTRLLGFNAGMGKDSDPFARAAGGPEKAAYTQFPVGWLVVVDGPGRGAAFTLFNGVSQIGRGEGQTVRLDFGDNSISRENHAAIAYDAEQNSFFIGHGGKANLVRCNNMPVLSTQALSTGDTIRVGETSLRFVPLCGDRFQWADGQKDQGSHAANG